MAGGGGAWKVAYADFVTAMMAFFLVMWLTSQQPEVKTAIAGYFSDPWGTTAEESSPVNEASSDIMTPRMGVEVPHRPPTEPIPTREPKDMGATGSEQESFWIRGYRMHVLQEGDRVPPAVTVLFDGESASLDPVAARQLQEAVQPMVGKSNRMEIRAHSNRRPLSPESPYKNHWELGFARSQAVLDFLVTHGIEPQRVRLSQSASYEPLVDALTKTWPRENSRVEIYLLNEWTDPKPGIKSKQPADGRADKGRAQPRVLQVTPAHH